MYSHERRRRRGRDCGDMLHICILGAVITQRTRALKHQLDIWSADETTSVAWRWRRVAIASQINFCQFSERIKSFLRRETLKNIPAAVINLTRWPTVTSVTAVVKFIPQHHGYIRVPLIHHQPRIPHRGSFHFRFVLRVLFATIFCSICEMLQKI